MAERFERLYKLPDNLYKNESPIIISAGALLKDSQTGSIIVQLKFHSVSENTIKAVKISLSTFDVSGMELQGVKDYQYLDLSICNGQEFGTNKAIVLPSAVTRSFAISDITVVFSNGNQWKCDDTAELASLPTQKYLSTELRNAEIEKQYQIATTPSATYVPSEMMSIWNCTCGEWNSSERCTKCGAIKQAVFSSLNVDELKIKAENRLAFEKAQREEQERFKEEERQETAKRLVIQKERRKIIIKKTKIILAILLPVIALVLTFALWIYPDIIKPNIAYNKAEQLFSAGQYSDAATVFQALGDFKDSPERLNEVVNLMVEDIYNYGTQLIQDEKYENALQTFEEIIEYGINPSLIVKAKYQKAICLSELGRMEDAIACLENIPDYPDSAETLKKFKYQYACELFLDCKYLESIELFNAIPDYLDSTQKIESAYSLYYFDRGNTYYKEAKFYLAIEEFKKTKEENASEMIVKAEKEIAYINNVCGKYHLVEEYWFGSKVTLGPANRDYCTVSFDFENGCFIFDNNKYVVTHSFAYSFDRSEKYHYSNHYQGGKDYDYQFIDGRLLWDEGNNTYEYYEKE